MSLCQPVHDHPITISNHLDHFLSLKVWALSLHTHQAAEKEVQHCDLGWAEYKKASIAFHFLAAIATPR
jgi:hypothetical protein